ncbi:MAG TPA: creatininase family protein [Planctomycetota bacterium]|nr:creatininase family protein [Planctomycetota bacterium]
MHLAELTTYEVDALARDLPVVVPFSAIEQHGAHLPIGTDTYIVEGILRRVDERDPNACLWLPVERFGSSPHHMPFRGSVTLSSRTFLDVALELVESFVHHGFSNFVLFNGHGGNRAHLDVAVQEIRMGGGRVATARTGDRARRVVHATYWSIARDAFAEIRESPLGGMGHACEMETSAMLALHPELVRPDRLRADGSPPRSRFDARDMLEGGSIGQFRFFDEMSKTGPIGDPSTASAEKGRRFIDAAASALLELLATLREGKAG